MSAAIAAGTAVRSPRAAAVAGIVFSVLLTVALVLVRSVTPSDPNDAGDWLADGGRRKAVVVELNLLPFAAIAFLWFIGVVRDRIGEGEDRFFATVFLGSGLVFVAMMLATGAVAGGLLFTADDKAIAASQPAIWANRIHLAAHSYRVGAVVGIQPALAGFLLDDAAGGLPQRFAWFSTVDPGASVRSPSWPGPLDWTPPSWEHWPAEPHPGWARRSSTMHASTTAAV
jgi:hypothetical protein